MNEPPVTQSLVQAEPGVLLDSPQPTQNNFVKKDKLNSNQETEDMYDSDLHTFSYATFTQRALAAILDGILLITLISVINNFTNFAGKYIDKNNPFSTLLLIILFILQSATYIIQSIYFIYFTAKTGQTLGKKILHIKVIQIINHNPPTFIQAFLREAVGKLASTLIGFIGYLWPLWDDKKQALHDKIAGTIVITST